MSDQLRDDQYYLDMIRAGNVSQGLEGLWLKYQPDLFRYCGRLCQRYSFFIEAEDLASEVWLQFAPYATKREVRNVGGLLTRIARGLAYHMARERRHEALTEDNIPDETEIDNRLMREAEQLDARQTLSDLRLMNLLSPCQRVFFTLRSGFEMPPRAIELLTGKSTNVISASISQAKAWIRKYMQSSDYEIQETTPSPNRYRIDLFSNDWMPTELYRTIIKEHSRYIEGAHLLVPTGTDFIVDKLYYFVCISTIPSDFLLFDLFREENEFRIDHPRVTRIDLYNNEQEFEERNRVIRRSITESPVYMDDDRYPVVHWRIDVHNHSNEKTYPAKIIKLDIERHVKGYRSYK